MSHAWRVTIILIVMDKKAYDTRHGYSDLGCASSETSGQERRRESTNRTRDE